MASNVMISTNVSKVVITVVLMPLAPIQSVVGLVHVIPVTKVMVSVVLILMNDSLAHVMPSQTVATMLYHTHALAMMDSMVTVKSADINECLNADACHADATCTNSHGSHSCACNDGYSDDGMNCADNDECVLETDKCDVNATCATLADPSYFVGPSTFAHVDPSLLI